MNATVYMLVGVPGSGKSTTRAKLVQRHPNAVVLCPDDHLMVKGKYVWTRESCSAAWAKCHKMFKDVLRAGGVAIWDATFTNPGMRHGVVREATKYHSKVIAYEMNTPFSVCEERNAARTEDRRVPPDAMGRMIANYMAPHMREGFEKIVVVDTSLPKNTPLQD